MKTIGLIGGMSWESSIEYYRIINQSVRTALGGLHSAQSVMYSVDFAEVEALQMQHKWVEATAVMIDAAQRVERAGADFVVICTNTMHKMAADVQAAIQIPLLHIADATAAAVKAQGFGTIGLLGTNFTMEQDFYKGRLVDQHNLNVLIPNEADRQVIHRIIYDELCAGVIKQDSRKLYAQIIQTLIDQGAQGIILGCTEIALLVKPGDSAVPLFDTTLIHAQAAVNEALK